MTDLLRHPDDALSALLDGQLEADEAAAVQAHLVACSACTAELEAQRETRAAVRSLPAVEPPSGFFEGLLAGGLPVDEDLAVAGRVLPLRSRKVALGNAAAAVAAGLLLVVAFGGNQAQAVAPQVSRNVERHAQS
ncbi:MAG: hypothetical protein JWO68_2114, partial [Actinomycetia bacterium]|nr:hypothetical protein [Actinomycetes bacterium]